MLSLLRPSTTTINFIESKNAYFAKEKDFKSSISALAELIVSDYDNIVKVFQLGAYIEPFLIKESDTYQDYVDMGFVDDDISNLIIFDFDNFLKLKEKVKKTLSEKDYSDFVENHQFISSPF